MTQKFTSFLWVLALGLLPLSAMAQTAPASQSADQLATEADALAEAATDALTTAPDSNAGEVQAPSFDPNLNPAAALAATVDMPEGSPDYVAWGEVARRAEAALEAGRASDDVLETLRSEVAGWRETFAAARDLNDVRISTLRKQLSALGAPPAEGGSESSVIARQREVLAAQLEVVETPVLAATLAHARAEDIVTQLDVLLRGRQTDTLLGLGPSPLNPAHWAEAFDEVSGLWTAARRELSQNWANDTARAEFFAALPAVIIFGLLGVILSFFGRRAYVRVTSRLLRVSKWPARGIWGFVLSLGEIVLPVLGVFFLMLAVDFSALFGTRSGLIVNTVLAAVPNIIGARWLGVRLFGRGDASWEILNLPENGRIEGRVAAVLAGYGISFHEIGSRISDAENFSEGVAAVIAFPALVFTGLLLLRIGRLLRTHAVAAEEQAEVHLGFRDRLLSLGGRALILVGILGPLVALPGMGALGQFMVYATLGILGLIALLLVLHMLYVDLYGLAAKKDLTGAQEALVPVLASLATMLAATPLLAIILGARTADIGEVWTRAGQGISFGDTTITPSNLILLVVIFAIGFGVTRFIQGMLSTTVLPKTKMEIGGQTAITSGVGYVGYFLAALVAITAAGIDLSSLAIVAGALSVGIGFGLQAIVSNFVSGIILLIERPISEGDWISVGGNQGIVKDISVRATRIETFDKQDVVVPNSDFISGTVTNYTRGNTIGRLVLRVGVAYGSDTRKICKILLEIAQENPLVTVKPEPQVTFFNFGADALEFELRAVLSDIRHINEVKDEINHRIAERFAEEGIEVPFAQRDIWLRNPEMLVQAAVNTSAPDMEEVDEDGEGDGE